jgi:hypothetical protein
LFNALLYNHFMFAVGKFWFSLSIQKFSWIISELKLRNQMRIRCGQARHPERQNCITVQTVSIATIIAGWQSIPKWRKGLEFPTERKKRLGTLPRHDAKHGSAAII